VLAVSALAAWGTATGRGPFYLADTHTSLWTLWTYMTTLVLVSLAIAALQAEARRAGVKLRENRERLAALVEGIPDAIFFKDGEGRWLITNESAKQLFQLHHIPWQGKTDRELAELQPALRAAHEICLADDRKAWEAGQLTLFEEQITTGDGRPHTFDVRKVPIFGHTGQRLGLVVVSRDITGRKQIEAAFRTLSRAVEYSPVSIVITDTRGEIQYVNPMFERITGYTSAEATGQNPRILSTGETSTEEYRELWDTLLSGKTWQGEFHNRRKDGTLFWEQASISPVFDERGTLTHFVAVKEDITERKHAERELRIAATAFETQEGILVTDANAIILRVNRAFTRITGYAAAEVIGQTPAMFASGRQGRDFYQNLWRALARDRFWQGELWNRRKSGEVYPEWLSITAVAGQDGAVTHYVAAFSDITQRKQDEAEIRNLAFYDSLTQLPNRRLLMERLRHAMASSTRNLSHGALLFIDLDNFKTLNDTKGHDVGDLLLIEVARRLQTCLREGDTVARLGGDEFVVLIEGLSEAVTQAAAQAEAVGEKIRESINQPYRLRDFEHHASGSIGISLFRGHDVAADELFKRADTAMYQAKHSGRNALRFFDPTMQTALEVRMALEADLRQALAQRQFTLYYQVQVDHTGCPIGAEVLLRWIHPTRGLLLPAEFIPLAEESGLILTIGQWVLETTCAQLKQWEIHPQTRHLQLAVNVSTRQFRQMDFVERVRTALNRTGAAPARLKLELTEGTVLGDVVDAIAKIRALKETGVNISIDDFGTGYSSLSYLQRLPIQQLKIDQSFIHDLTEHSNLAIVRAILTLGEDLGLDVMAEGVETEEQRAFLVAQGCHAFQGHLFSQPLPLEAFTTCLKELANRRA
jgi:diguanylate cyclase (GGDEF)-like protein/PAS domain S-box-containing protein